MEKNKAKVKPPIHLFVALVLAVVALACSLYFYFGIPGTSDGVAEKPLDPAMRIDEDGRALAKAKKYAEAIAQYSQALTMRPGDYLILMDRAQSYYNQRDYQAALNDYQFALSSNAKIDPQADQVSCATNAMLGVALCQEALDRPSMAVKTLHDLQAKDGHYIKAYQVLGDIYLKTDDSLSALDAYTQGLRLNPKSSELHYDRSLAYTKRNMKEQAFDDLSSAIELDRSSLNMYITHANMANKLGKPEIADSDAREILRLEPSNRSARSWLKRRNKPLSFPAENAPAKGTEGTSTESAEKTSQPADKNKAAQAPDNASKRQAENTSTKPSDASAKVVPEKPVQTPNQKPDQKPVQKADDKSGPAEVKAGSKNAGQQGAVQAEKAPAAGVEKTKEKATDKTVVKTADGKEKIVPDRPAIKTPDKQGQKAAAKGASEPVRDPGTRPHGNPDDYFVRESAGRTAPD